MADLGLRDVVRLLNGGDVDAAGAIAVGLTPKGRLALLQALAPELVAAAWAILRPAPPFDLGAASREDALVAALNGMDEVRNRLRFDLLMAAIAAVRPDLGKLLSAPGAERAALQEATPRERVELELELLRATEVLGPRAGARIPELPELEDLEEEDDDGVLDAGPAPL